MMDNTMNNINVIINYFINAELLSHLLGLLITTPYQSVAQSY